MASDLWLRIVFVQKAYDWGTSASVGVPTTERQFGFVAEWVSALNANGDLADSLRSLMRLVRADAIKLIRGNSRDSTMRIISRCDVEDGRIYCTSGREVLVDAVFGDQQYSARPGSVWSLSDATSTSENDFKSVASARAERMSVRDVEIVVLECSKPEADFLEIHFRSEPLKHNTDLLKILASTISSAWRKRRAGLVAMKINETKPRIVGAETDAAELPILDISNPIALSRCEYRVATLLREGMTVKNIAETLSVCQATVRSHLSSIYSKSGATGQVELLHFLNQDRMPDLLSG